MWTLHENWMWLGYEERLYMTTVPSVDVSAGLAAAFPPPPLSGPLMSNEPGCSYPWLHLIPFHLPERSGFFFPLKMLMTKVESWGQRERCCFGGCDSSLEEKPIRSCSGRRTPAALRPRIPFLFLFTPVWFFSTWSILSFKLSTMSGPSSDQLHRSTLSIYGVSFCRLLVFCLWCRHSARWTIRTWEEWLGPGLVLLVLTSFFTCRI